MSSFYPGCSFISTHSRCVHCGREYRPSQRWHDPMKLSPPCPKHPHLAAWLRERRETR